MISLMEQGFIRRNLPGLALGAGAIAVGNAAMDDPANLPSAVKKAAKSVTRNAVEDRPVSPKVAALGRTVKRSKDYGDFSKGVSAWKEKGGKAVMQVRQKLSNIDPDAAVQKGVRKVGQIARTTKDYADRTAGSFRSGYSANVPKLPSRKYDAQGNLLGL